MTRTVHHLPNLSLLSPRLLRTAADAVLSAHRVGSLATLCREHPAGIRGLLRRWGNPVLWIGEVRDAASLAWGVETLIAWALEQARPDGLGESGGDRPIPRHAWLGATPWRPLLALASQYGFIEVPNFPDRYHARVDEPAFERLCGLWDIAPSSFYRYVEKGRDQVIAELMQRLSGLRFVSLCRFAQRATDRRRTQNPTSGNSNHSHTSTIQKSAIEALWKTLQTPDSLVHRDVNESGVVTLLESRCSEFAASAHTDDLLNSFGVQVGSSLVRFALARAAIARVRADVDGEQNYVASALRAAEDSDETLLVAEALAARGRFHEVRDVDKAFADYRESVARYDEAMYRHGTATPFEGSPGLLSTLVRLAYLHVRRNDPRSTALLERAEQLRMSTHISLDIQALLERAWSEHRRRSGDDQQALEATHRALHLYERSGNHQQRLRMEATLVLMYANARRLDESLLYAERIFAVARAGPVEPQTLASTHLNVGIAYFWAGAWDSAIASYQTALAQATRHGLRPLIGQANYNLAETLYKRFGERKEPQDETRADTHTQLSYAIWIETGDKAAATATANLKRAVLGESDTLIYDRMLPGELVAHFDEMSEIQTERLLQSAPRDAADRIRASLKIARAYMEIAVKEREAAIALIAEHGDRDAWESELMSIRSTFERALSLDEKIDAHWRATAGLPVPSEAIQAVVRTAVTQQGLSKSRYAELCSVSPATASKHLTAMAELGLLSKSGNGPATRYTATMS